MKWARLAAIIFLVIVALACVFAERLAPADYAHQFRDIPNAPASRAHLLGTDDLGRDRFSRVLYGTRISLLLAPVAALITCFLAAVVGGTAGFVGGGFERAVMSGTDLFLSLPWFFLLITARALMPLNVSPITSVIITFALLGQLAARTGKLFLDFVQCLAILSSAVIHYRGQLVSSGRARSGVTCMKRWLASLVIVVLALGSALAQSGSELRFCLWSEPKTFNPLLVQDDSSETVRYLTAGVQVRLNRQTPRLEPELATAWKVSKDGRTITFALRQNVRSSDGTAFSADDVAYTVQQMMDPNLHSPTGDSFRSGEGKVETRVLSGDKIAITFPAPIAGLDKLFDQVAIMSAKSPKKEMAVLGPYYVADYKAGSYLHLQRNPNYWKHDSSGRQLPYIDSVRLDIQQNRDIEILRLLRSEEHTSELQSRGHLVCRLLL